MMKAFPLHVAEPATTLPRIDPLQPLRTGKVAIVGFSETRSQAPFDDPDTEIWVCNRLALLFEKEGKRWDRHFDPHPLEWSAKGHPPEVWKEYESWLWADHGNRQVYLPPSEFPGVLEVVPNAVPYPLDLVLEQVSGGRRYFTSAIAYQIGLALALKAKWIGLWGIDLRDISEYEFQRPCAERLLGIAEGRGVEIYLPPTSALLNADGRSGLYGIEAKQGFFLELEKAQAAELKEVQKKMKELQDMNEKCLEQLNQWAGYELCLKNWILRAQRYPRGGVF